MKRRSFFGIIAGLICGSAAKSSVTDVPYSIEIPWDSLRTLYRQVDPAGEGLWQVTQTTKAYNADGVSYIESIQRWIVMSDTEPNAFDWNLKIVRDVS